MTGNNLDTFIDDYFKEDAVKENEKRTNEWKTFPGYIKKSIFCLVVGSLLMIIGAIRGGRSGTLNIDKIYEWKIEDTWYFIVGYIIILLVSVFLYFHEKKPEIKKQLEDRIDNYQKKENSNESLEKLIKTYKIPEDDILTFIVLKNRFNDVRCKETSSPKDCLEKWIHVIPLFPLVLNIPGEVGSLIVLFSSTILYSIIQACLFFKSKKNGTVLRKCNKAINYLSVKISNNFQYKKN